jgi:hypothetical protein
MNCELQSLSRKHLLLDFVCVVRIVRIPTKVRLRVKLAMHDQDDVLTTVERDRVTLMDMPPSISYM